MVPPGSPGGDPVIVGEGRRRDHTEAEKEEEFRKAGYSLVSAFRLPRAGWQKEYYDPMMRIVAS